MVVRQVQPVWERKEEAGCNGMKRESSVDAVKYVVSLPRISRRIVLPYVTYSRRGSDAVPPQFFTIYRKLCK
jgi:hypothetical protein